MSKSIMANSMLNAAAGMLLLVTGFACSIIAARMLGPEANGVIAFSLWFAITGALVAELGTGVLLMRMLPKLKAEGYDAKRRRGFAALLLTPTLVSTTALAIVYALIFLGSEELHWVQTAPTVIVVTGALFVIQSIGAFTKNYLIGEQRVFDFFKLTAIASVLQLTTVLGGAYYYGVEGALVGYAAGQAVLFLYTLTLVFEKRDFCDTPAKFLISSSLMLSAGYVIDSVFLNRIEILFLQQFWSVEMVGYYAVSLSLANLALQLPIQLTGSLLPYYAAQRQTNPDGQLSASVFSGVIRALLYITLPMSFGLAGIATPLVTAIFGPAFAPAGPMVALLALSSPAYVLMQILTQYLFSIDMMKSRLFAGLIGSGVLVIGCFIAVPEFGGEGAAIVRLLAFSLMCMAMVRMTGFGRNLHQLYGSLAKVALSSLAVAAAAFATTSLIAGLPGLMLGIIIGVIAYPIGLRLTGAIPAEDGAMLRAMAGKIPGSLGNHVGQLIVWVAPVTLEPLSETPKPDPNGVGAGRKAAWPVAFGGIAGLFQPELEGVKRRDTAALLLPPWGFEDLCARKFYRILAEELGAAGIANLRIDYPGTGDSRDLGPDEGLGAWIAAATAAVSELRRLTGLENVMIIGQGPGAALAQRVAQDIGGAAGVAMLAPMLSGRLYLRETALMSVAIDQGLGLREEQRHSQGLQIASFTLPAAIAEALKKINLSAGLTRSAPHYLLLSRANPAAETALGEDLQRQGGHVALAPFEGYDALVANPTIQVMPLAVVARIVAWAQSISGVDVAGGQTIAPTAPAVIASESYTETLLRFGSGEHLYGVLCEPKVRNAEGSPTLILTTAYDRAAGWGRSGAETARTLASLGIASLRYDAANVGDSPPRPDAPTQVLYSATQVADAQAALDLLDARFGRRMVISGRCSGGYVALRAAHADPRVAGVVSVNPYTFYWDPSKPVANSLQFVPRSLDDYGQRLARLDTFKRLMSGDVDIAAASKNILIAVGKRLGAKLKPILRFIDSAGPEHHETIEMFKTYQQRGVDVRLAYSEGDVGLEAMRRHFGERGEKLTAFSTVKLVMIPDADHNLTPPSARRIVMDELLGLTRGKPQG